MRAADRRQQAGAPSELTDLLQCNTGDVWRQQCHTVTQSHCTSRHPTSDLLSVHLGVNGYHFAAGLETFVLLDNNIRKTFKLWSWVGPHHLSSKFDFSKIHDEDEYQFSDILEKHFEIYHH